MLGVPGLMANASAEGATAEAQESGGTSGGSGGGGGGGGGFSEEGKARIEEEGERAAAADGGGGGSSGNRWPQQETLALLKIRSDMDGVFRDSSLKGPLWEQVSRKMADLGYHRSAKKCKEKFENVYKYHKRTKEGRSTKPEGKTYRFFDQLEALENTSSSSAHHQLPPAAAAPPPPRPPQAPTMAASAATPMQAAITANNPIPNAAAANVAQNSTTAATSTTRSFNNFINSTFPPTQALVPQQATTTTGNNPSVVPPSHQTLSTSFLSNFTTSSSSTSSNEDNGRRRKRKRKWKAFFQRLMKDVIDKQEELQKRFLETLEKRERDRMIREEAWRVQEMARINREHELLVQERSTAAARESALVSFLQKMTQQQNPQNPNSTNPPQVQVQIPILLPEITPPPRQAPPPPAPPAPPAAPPTTTDNTRKSDNGGENFTGSTSTSSSRWPKDEVQALIELRTSMDTKYQEAGPKGPLWEDISAGMRRLGYNRSAKRCKEKWENINKYFKKVKESNKKRTEDSKTCPYFHQLDALYREKAKADASLHTAGYGNAVPIMARPEQQWPLSHDQQQPLQESAREEHERGNVDQNDHNDDDDEDDDGDEDEEDEGGGYEIVTNKPPSSVATTTIG